MTAQIDLTAATEIPPEILAGALAVLHGPGGQRDPYPQYARLLAAGAAGVAPDGALVAVGYEACAALLRERRLVKTPGRLLSLSGYPDWEQRPALRMLYGSMLMRNPPEHTRLRAAVSATFTARRVADLAATVGRNLDDLLGALDGEFDFVDAVAFPLPVAVIGELIGIPPADRPMFQQLVRDWTIVLDSLVPAAVDRADAAAAAMAGYFADLLRQRRSRPREDLVSALAAQPELGGDELVTMLALLLGAGFETTTGLLANGLLALLAAPEQADRLRRHPGMADQAAQELLRYDTPVQMLFGRSAVEAIEVAALHLAAGQRVITVVGAANRDPRVYPDPDRLDLGRGGPAPLSFGGGIHYCLGAPLARLEAAIAFPAVLRAFPRLQLTGAPQHRDGLTLHSYMHIPVSTR